MHVLVAYASRHGATRGIAERIAEDLRMAGLDAEARPAAGVRDPATYDAFVIGGAAYTFRSLALQRAVKARDHRVFLAPTSAAGSRSGSGSGSWH